MLALLPNLSEAVAATDASCAAKNEILQNSSRKSSEDKHMQICFTSCMLPAIGWSQRSYNSHLSVCRVETQTPGVAVPCDGPSHAAQPIAVGQCCRARSWGVWAEAAVVLLIGALHPERRQGEPLQQVSPAVRAPCSLQGGAEEEGGR